MRTVINISLPEALAKEVRKEVKEGHFASVSEFFRHVLRMWNTEKLYRDVEILKKQYKKGDFKILKSLKDLR